MSIKYTKPTADHFVLPPLSSNLEDPSSKFFHKQNRVNLQKAQKLVIEQILDAWSFKQITHYWHAVGYDIFFIRAIVYPFFTNAMEAEKSSDGPKVEINLTLKETKPVPPCEAARLLSQLLNDYFFIDSTGGLSFSFREDCSIGTAINDVKFEEELMKYRTEE